MLPPDGVWVTEAIDKAAAFATRAKLRSQAWLPYENVRTRRSSATAYTLVNGLYAPDVQSTGVLGDA